VSKIKKNKNQKSHLTAEEKKMGKMHIYILISMIFLGLAVALYQLQ
jgi:hypothetical protein